MALDLSNEEKLALVTLLTSNIAQDRHQSSAQVRSLKHILLKLDPKPPAQPSSPRRCLRHRREAWQRAPAGTAPVNG